MPAADTLKDPRRYFEAVDVKRAEASAPPVCLYLEVTNRCNLLCETCPRTFETLEPPADMSWELFTRIVDQVPNVARVVLHGVGEPMLVKDLPRMVRYLKDRGTYVLFNTNGTLLQPEEVPGADRHRAGRAARLARCRRPRILRARSAARTSSTASCATSASSSPTRRQVGATTPRVSLWLTGLKETVEQLPDFVRLAAAMGVQRGASAAPGVRRGRLRHGARRTSRCSRARRPRSMAAIAAAQAIGADARRHAGCLRRHRARPQPEAADATTSPGRPAAGPGR